MPTPSMQLRQRVATARSVECQCSSAYCRVQRSCGCRTSYLWLCSFPTMGVRVEAHEAAKKHMPTLVSAVPGRWRQRNRAPTHACYKSIATSASKLASKSTARVASTRACAPRGVTYRTQMQR